MKKDLSPSLNRRHFFATSGAAALSVAASPSQAKTTHPDSEKMVYEVIRTEKEWIEQLGEFSYFIMRKGLTEEPKSSPLWKEFADGTYHCKGCDLTNYESKWKVPLDKGWVFFDHAVEDAVLLGMDGPVEQYGQMASSDKVLKEIHCRRCGGHLGHLVVIQGVMTHCINGAALTFKPTET